MKNANNLKTKIELVGLPDGPLSLEAFMESEKGKELIPLLKQTTDEPEKLICAYLVAFQFMNMVQQYEDLGHCVDENSYERALLYCLAEEHVKNNIAHLVGALGQKKVQKIFNALAPQEVTLHLHVFKVDPEDY